MDRKLFRFCTIALVAALLAAGGAQADLDQAMNYFKTGKYVEAAATVARVIDDVSIDNKAGHRDALHDELKEFTIRYRALSYLFNFVAFGLGVYCAFAIFYAGMSFQKGEVSETVLSMVYATIAFALALTGVLAVQQYKKKIGEIREPSKLIPLRKPPRKQ